MQTRKLHLNKPQLRSDLIGAESEVAIMGRGTGKTEVILALKSARRYFGTMPRGTGVKISATFNQALTRTLPALVAGWERLGYINNVHFVVGKKPSEKWIKLWKWKGPFRPPFSYQYFISWWNGGGAHIVSQDRQGSSNGITIDWIIGDEAKLLNRERFQTELLPANRGIIKAFANNPWHHGVTLTSDMPVGTAGRWLLEYADKMDRKKINAIWAIQTARYQLVYLLKKETRAAYINELKKQIAVLDDELSDLRRNLLYYHEASTLENIHALGIEYIKQQLRDTTPFQFDTQILNLRPLKLEDGFYPDFDEEAHGYFANNNSFLDNLEYDFEKIKDIDCRRDDDIISNAPLHIALDYNRRIHPLVVAQDTGPELRTVKGLHSLYPGKLKEVLQLFIDYYRPHNRKMVYYWYDHTAVGDQHETKICDDVINALDKGGWVVIPMYIGKAPAHELKYRMWGHLLNNTGKYNKTFRVNRENCDKLILSMYQAQAEQKKDGFGKDKKSEQDANFPADESTHYSDAMDTLAFGLLESELSYTHEEAGDGTIILG
jgi:hypothetical protein